MGCESLYRLWNSHLARKGIIQFAALVLISQVEWAYLPVAGYLRQMDSRAAELSLTERAIAMESAYYYYGAYLTADSEAVAVGVKDAGAQAAKTEEFKTDAGVAGAVESETEAAKTAVDTAGAEKTETKAAKTEVGAAGAEITETEGAETEDAGGSELKERSELADLEAEGVQDAQTEALEEMRIQIVDSDEQGTPAGIQIQPEIQEGMLKEQNRSGNKSTEIPQEEYFKQDRMKSPVRGRKKTKVSHREPLLPDLNWRRCPLIHMIGRSNGHRTICALSSLQWMAPPV